MIRFSAALVVVAVGVLIGGVATSSLLLVYVAIILSAAALIALAVGVALKRDELFGVTGQPVRDVMGAAAEQSAPGQRGTQPPSGQAHAGQALGGWPASGSESGNFTLHGDLAGGQASTAGPAVSRPAEPPAASRPGVAETRTDMKAIGADTPGKAGQRAGSGQPETRIDSPAGAGEARTGGNKAGSEETRFDLPPVRPSEKPAGRERDAGETRLDLPAARAGEKRPGSQPTAGETRLDLSPVLADEAASRKPAAGADETRLDLPAQPAASAAPGPASQSAAPAASGAAARPSPTTGPETGGKAVSGEDQVAVIPGVPRYHAPNCILIRFMEDEDLQKMTLDEAKAAGCTPCTACQAD